MAETLFEKIWSRHVVREERGTALIYIDLHLVHEVTSPQAFESLRLAGRRVRRPDLTVATMDHNVPTTDPSLPIADQTAKRQMDTLVANCREFGIPCFGMGDPRQGIVHIIGPELGLTQPGLTIVCGDSHTATHGAFGALAFGIGTSEVEHVLATQTLVQRRPQTMEVRIDGARGFGVTAKDLILGVIGAIGVDGAVGHVIEYTGEAIRALTMEGRMTVCNMSIEGGARAGMVAPDDTTIAYLAERPAAPPRRRLGRGRRRLAGAAQRRGGALRPHGPHRRRDGRAPRDLGHQSRAGGADPGAVPDPEQWENRPTRAAVRALEYMGLTPGTPLRRSPSTGSSSAPAPTAGSRTCGPPRGVRGRRVARPSRRWWSRGRCG